MGLLKTKRGKILSGIVIGGLFIFSITGFFLIKDGDLKTMCLGVFSSLLASAVWAGIVFWVNGPSTAENIEKANEIFRQVGIVKNAEDCHIECIKKRYEFDDDFWLGFIENLGAYSILSGKTMGRWVGNTMRIKSDTQKRKCNAFISNIQKALREDKEVSIVIYNDKSLGDNETDKKEKKTLKQIIKVHFYEKAEEERRLGNKLKEPKLHLERLHVYEVDPLPYLYNFNGKKTIYAPYFFEDPKDGKKISNDDNIMIVFDGSEQKYNNDFTRFMETGSECLQSWINEWESSPGEGND